MAEHNKARKRRHRPRPNGRPRGTWAKDVGDLQSAFKKYIKYCEKQMVDYPTQKGTVIKYNKKRVPTLGLFLTEYLGVSYNTWIKWRSTDWVQQYAEGTKNYDESKAIMAQAIHDEANFIHDSILYRMEDALANNEGSSQGLIFILRTNYDKNPNQVVEYTGDSKIQVEVIMTNKDEPEDKN